MGVDIKKAVQEVNQELIVGDYPYRLDLDHFLRLEKEEGNGRASVALAQCKKHLGIN